MTGSAKRGPVPKLRFPKFREAGGWEEGKLITLSNEPLSNGVFNDPKKVGVGYKLINVSDMYIDTAIDEGRLSLLELAQSDFEVNQVKHGDIFFTRSSLVKSGIAVSNIYLGSSSDVTFDGHLIRFRANTNKVVPLFAHYLFKTTPIRAQLIARGKSATMTTIGQADVASVVLFNPEKEEQQKIANCLASLDRLLTLEAQKLDTLKTHKKGLMQQLFPAEGETLPKLRFPEFRDAGEWEEENLERLAHFQDGFAFKSTDFVKSKEDATQVIRITDINNKNSNEDKVYVPDAFLEFNNLDKYTVDNGDLLLSLTGAAGFNFFFWDGGRAVINQRTAKITPKKKSDYALGRLLEPLVHEKINARGEGQNNNLSKEFLSSLVLLIPEPAEQQKIADCLTSLDDLITAQTQKLAALKTHKKGLMQQLFPSADEVAG